MSNINNLVYEFFSTLNNPIENLHHKMNQIQYGYYSDKLKKPLSGEEIAKDEKHFYEHGRVLQPDEVWKHKIGTCFDQSLLAHHELKKMGHPTKLVYVRPQNGNAHMSTFFKKDDNWHRFEHSWHQQSGIHGPYKNLNHGIDHMIQQMKDENPKLKNIKVNKSINPDSLLGDYNLSNKKFYSYINKNFENI